MFRNYLKVAIRQLLRNKVYVVINTLGMGIAMACCLTSYLLIAYNIEFDHYFREEQVRHVVKVMHHYQTAEGKPKKELAIPFDMAPRAAQEIAGIEAYTRFTNHGAIIHYGTNAFHENIRFADASFFQLFDLKLAKGSIKNFNDQQSVFLSGAMAKKYFADEDPIGKTISIELNGKLYEKTVGGVLDRIPLNISFDIYALLRIETYFDAFDIKPGLWDVNESSTALFKLTDGKQREVIAQQLQKYVQLNHETQKDSRSLSFELVPFMQPIVREDVTAANLRLPIPTTPQIIFSVLGLIILLIACFNLTNTTMAMAGKRQKEIGVRKVIGSGRLQIAYQFLLEMAITISLAIVAGVLMAQITVPRFTAMWQLEYGLGDLSRMNFLATLVLLLFVTCILAGIYPVISNSKFNPIALLKGNTGVKGTTFLSRTLLVAQFSLSVIVLMAGIVFTQNASYQKNISFGYDLENLLNISVQGEQEYNLLKNVLTGNSKIENIAGASRHIGPYAAYWRPVRIDTATFKTNIYSIGFNYFKTVGLDFVDGRDFMEGSQADFESNVIIDENFALNHGITNAIDARIIYNDKPYHVIGVVKNHLSGLKQKDDSDHIYLLSNPSDFSVMVVRTSKDDLTAMRAEVERSWKKIFPGKPFQSSLQKETVYEESTQLNNNLTQIFFFLTLLGCLLSASGIYAMASLNVQKRTKEIGVRKVLGASVRSIIQLLNKDFAIILTLAGVIGGTGGYLLTNALMNNLYTQHIDITVTTVALCGLAIFLIGIMATSSSIVKAANTNPSRTLKMD